MPPENMTPDAPAMDEGDKMEVEEGLSPLRRKCRVRSPGGPNRIYPFSFSHALLPLFSFLLFLLFLVEWGKGA